LLVYVLGCATVLALLVQVEKNVKRPETVEKEAVEEYSRRRG